MTAGSPSQIPSKPTRKIPVRKIATQLHLQNHTVVTSSSNADIESIPTWDLDPSPAAFISVEYTDVTDHDSNANEGKKIYKVHVGKMYIMVVLYGKSVFLEYILR